MHPFFNVLCVSLWHFKFFRLVTGQGALTLHDDANLSLNMFFLIANMFQLLFLLCSNTLDSLRIPWKNFRRGILRF